MKKLLTILAVAAALAAVSCTKEREMNGDNGPMASVSFTVNSAELMTKADPGYGKATAIDQLLVQVFNQVGTEFVKLENPEVTITPNGGTLASWKVDMKLAKNETYKIAFWAQKSETGIYGTSDLSAVTVDYSKIAINNDNADAFCAARLVTVTGSLSQTVYLYRPLAQINIGTNDLAAYEKSVPAAKKNLTATITLPVETPNKLNVIGGTESEGVVKSAVTGTTTEEVEFTTAPSYVMSDQTLTSSNVNYSYLTMLYVLSAPNKETMTFKAKLNNGTTDVSDLTISNMPYQANYRTNIVGQLLTGSFEYNVEIEEGFADCEKIVSPTFATLAEMNDYLAILQDGTPEGDNGDINPEQVTLTALGTVSGTPQIVLPKILGGVDIRLAFEYDGTVEMVYADPADGAKKPANIFFYAQKLNTLEATVPQSHFELLSGSIVTNKAIVSTNTTTFVIQNGAKVGTAEIQKGNATIAGTVTTVSVPTGAKADDDNNPVKVFLEKVSSVDKIELKAKTDVVVEQPKDQIEVEATEKKVAVYVKEGAENSTAKAQNGGVIYVKAEVPCTVTADGTSEAEDGSAVSSTVIIEPGAAGSAVIAENGGAIDLTANGNCSASAEGVAEGEGDDPDTPSTITVTEVKDENVEISGNTSDGGAIETTTDTQGAVKYYVAQIVDGLKYESLYDAVAAAEAGATVEMINNSTETSGFTLTKSLTIDLCNYKVTYDSGTGSVDTNKYPNSRAIKVGGSEAISVTVENGTIVVGNNVYGPFRIENANADVVLDKLTLNNSMAYGLGTKIVNAHSVVISNTVVNSVVGGGIEKGCDCPTTLTNVTVNQTEEDTQHPWISTALSTEYGGPLTVESGTYSGKVAAYLFSSGGTMNINGGSFTGNEAAIRVQNNTQEQGWVGPSTINISGGTFVGPLILDAWGNATPVPSSVMNISGGTFTTTSGQGALFQVNGNYSHLTITGGTFSEDPSAYVPEGYIATYDSTTQMWTVEEDAVAKIGTKTYGTLAKAFADAQENDEIIVLKNCAVSTNIPVNFPVTLNVAGFTITNNVTGNRMFRVGGETLFEIKGGGGKIVIPESNKNSYGFVDLRNQQNVASYYAGLKASNVAFNGATTGGSFFQARTHYQQFLFENVNVDCTDGDGIVYGGYANGLNASIINCYNCQICTVSIKGGTFKYASRGVNYGVFQDYLNASTTLEDVTVISTDGPVNQGMSYSCLIKNCNFANPNNVSAWDWTNTCICAASNKTIVVDGGSYEGNYACYVYTSGGTIHIKDGSFTGRTAALIAQVDNSTYPGVSSNIIVDGGTFNGPIKMDQGANCSITINGGTFTVDEGQLFGTMYGTLTITGGTFSQNPTAYVASGYEAIDNGNGTWTVQEVVN